MDVPPKNLPILMGALRQEAVEGELVLEQNDGARSLYLEGGELVHLKSDAAGEQFGNYLLRQGILDFHALNELLANDERYRLGEKVIQWGMMSLEERDNHLQALQEQIMIHALEHPIIQWTWNPCSIEKKLEKDLHFKLKHRHFIWNTFQEANYLMDLLGILEAEQTWRWSGQGDLLDSLSDLPLTPRTAYALSFLGTEPIGFDTFQSLSGLGAEEGGRFIAQLWALGALALTSGNLPGVTPRPAAPEPPPLPVPAQPLPVPPPPLLIPPPPLLIPPRPMPAPGVPAPRPAGLPPAPPPLAFDPPRPPSTPRPPLEFAIQLDQAPPQPEFLDLETETEPGPPPPNPPLPPAPAPAPAEDSAVLARKYLKKARQLVLQDRTVEAIRCLEQSVQLEPDADSAYDAWLILGQLRLANPAWSTRSIDALQNASRIRPKAAEPWAAMGEVYLRKAFKANAVACFRRALELDPSVPIPPDVDLTPVPPNPDIPGQTGGILSRFRSILGRPDKP